MRHVKARLVLVLAAVTVVAFIATVLATDHLLDLLVLALLATVLVGAYAARRYARTALVYKRRVDSRLRPRTVPKSSRSVTRPTMKVATANAAGVELDLATARWEGEGGRLAGRATGLTLTSASPR